MKFTTVDVPPFRQGLCGFILAPCCWKMVTNVFVLHQSGDWLQLLKISFVVHHTSCDGCLTSNLLSSAEREDCSIWSDNQPWSDSAPEMRYAFGDWLSCTWNAICIWWLTFLHRNFLVTNFRARTSVLDAWRWLQPHLRETITCQDSTVITISWWPPVSKTRRNPLLLARDSGFDIQA